MSFSLNFTLPANTTSSPVATSAKADDCGPSIGLAAGIPSLLAIALLVALLFTLIQRRRSIDEPIEESERPCEISELYDNPKISENPRRSPTHEMDPRGAQGHIYVTTVSGRDAAEGPFNLEPCSLIINTTQPTCLMKSSDCSTAFVTHSHKVNKGESIPNFIHDLQSKLLTLKNNSSCHKQSTHLNSEHHLSLCVSQVSNSKYRDPRYTLYINPRDIDVFDGSSSWSTCGT